MRDELGDQDIEICEGRVGGGLILNNEEFEWLSGLWQQVTGERLAPTFQQRFEKMLLATAGDYLNN